MLEIFKMVGIITKGKETGYGLWFENSIMTKYKIEKGDCVRK